MHLSTTRKARKKVSCDEPLGEDLPEVFYFIIGVGEVYKV